MKAYKEIETKYYKTIFEQATAGEYSVTLLPNTLYKLEIVGAGGGTYGSRVDYGNGGWTAVVRSGGSGGLINTYFYIPNDTDTTFTVTIGLGGIVGNGVKGGNSIFALDDLNLLVAEGGNGGSTSTNNAIGGITSISTEFENNYMIKQTQNNGNAGGRYQELHVKGSAYYFSDWCVANFSGGLSPIDNTQYGYGAGAGCVNVTPYNGIDGYCKIMQQTTEDDYEIKEETAIYKLVRKKEGFDLSKFTVVGSPTITDDGVASGFAVGSYVNVPILDLSSGDFEVDVTFNFIPMNRNQIIYRCATNNYAGAFGFLIATTTDGKFYLSGSDKDVVTNITLTQATYKAKLKVKNQIAYVYLNDDLVIETPFTKSITNGYLSFGYGTDASLFAGSINLPSISITVDGEEVFTGAKEKFYAIGD